MPAGLISSDPAGDVFHQFARLQSMTSWWHWLLLGIVCVGVLSWVATLYRRDTAEMARAKRWTLLGLRAAAFVGILVFFLDLEKRSRSEIVENSRALVLVDTSLSMGIQDASTATRTRRIDTVIEQLAAGDLVDSLREDHDVIVYRFDESETPTEIASLPKRTAAAPIRTTTAATATPKENLQEARILAGFAAVGAVAALALLLVYCVWAIRGSGRDRSWVLAIGMGGLLTATILFAVAHLRHPSLELTSLLPGGSEPSRTPSASTTALPENADVVAQDDSAETIVDWSEVLAPSGTATQLGDALRSLVEQERGKAIAGIIVATDGGQNAGVDPEEAVRAAQSRQIPISVVGVGSTDRPKNVRVVDVEAPPRVYPGDSFTLIGYVQSSGVAGRTIKVSLHSFDDTVDRDTALAELEEEMPIRLREDGEPVAVRFEVTPRAQGRRRYEVSVETLEEDSDHSDDRRSAKVEIVDRKNRVLLLAGGPTREYRFLRDLLYRDRDTELDVLLQTSQPGMSQESDRLLTALPATPAELFEYDCLVAFDPDWLAIPPATIELIERWVAEEAGGLIVVAGPVHTPRWSNRRRSEPSISTIRALYPVMFYSRGSASLSLGRFSSKTPWPLQFTRDGKEAEFLWLGDDVLQNEQAWQSFTGIYGYYAVKDPKPGARVFSRFSDPTTAIDGELPIYMAGHFYGAGRVFFQASGEMWRIRAVDDAYFEQYYTKLIRWASQGRLLRDSTQGVLLVDKTRCLLGDSVSVRAVLHDAQHRPLSARQVTASLIAPDGSRQPLVLRQLSDATKGGMYAAQFTTRLEGDYRVELQPPQGDADELLAREVRVRIPARETERPERNDALLQNIADQTGGEYFRGFAETLGGSDGLGSINDRLPPQDRISYVAGTPDQDFERVLMTWLMGIICGTLCFEWLIRRLNRLA